MEDVEIFTKKLTVVTHGTTEIEITYTNNVEVVEENTAMFRRMLEKEADKFLGLDFEYIADYDHFEEEVAVIQLALHRHVLVFQMPRYGHTSDLVQI